MHVHWFYLCSRVRVCAHWPNKCSYCSMDIWSVCIFLYSTHTLNGAKVRVCILSLYNADKVRVCTLSLYYGDKVRVFVYLQILCILTQLATTEIWSEHAYLFCTTEIWSERAYPLCTTVKRSETCALIRWVTLFPHLTLVCGCTVLRWTFTFKG